MFPRIEILPMIAGETRRVEFDFGPGLAEGETISTKTISVRVLSGTDDAPSAIISGSATHSGSVVTQKLAPTITGVIYEVLCNIVTSLSQTLKLVGKLAVPPATDEEAEDQVPGNSVGELVVSYDSGNINVDLPPTVLMTGAENANGGLYQVNAYIYISIAGGAGLIELVVQFNDEHTGNLVERSCGTINTASVGDPTSTTFPINTQANSQILIGTNASVVVWPTYRIQVDILRL